MYGARVSDDGWMGAEAAAARLGVKPQTLYAYVSRGLVHSEPVPGTRRSRFLRADVERLAARQRGGGRARGLEVIVETELTMLDPGGRLAYRGWDVVAAVRSGATFEEIATWLWTGEREAQPCQAPAAALDAATRVTEAMGGLPVMDRVRAVVLAARGTDPLRDDRRPVAVAMAGRALVATVVDTLPLVDGALPPPPGAPVARRLWSRLTAHPPEPERVRVLEAALVLLADHELAASTLAARVTASTWADPYLVVEAGLAALGGPLHGAASRAARDVLREIDGGVSPAEAVGRRLRDRQLIPGFGHSVYRERDPRAALLLELLDDVGALSDPEIEVMGTMSERGLPFPNVDFAIASMAERHDMIEEAGEVLFATTRTVGWLAHAVEEYQHRLRFRPRAVYTGPAPSS
jgi:citrate synthase